MLIELVRRWSVNLYAGRPKAGPDSLLARSRAHENRVFMQIHSRGRDLLILLWFPMAEDVPGFILEAL
jgi:hypothetical protein